MSGIENHTLAIIIFSKDRAMQLHACITSLKKYAQHCDQADIFVLYKTKKYQYQYDQLSVEFNEISFVRETNLVEQTQKILLSYNTVMFVVDDTLFYRNFDFAVCLHHLFSHNKILGFSLRLGRNVNWFHIRNVSMKQPEFQKTNDNCFYFKWPGADIDFGYPLEISSSIYRSKDIASLLKGIRGDPGDIEGHLSRKKRLFIQSRNYLLCFSKSVAFATPVNIVRDNTCCPAGRKYFYPVKKLASLFDQGFRIDISPPSEKINACHTEVEYKFVEGKVE